jgi:predicted nucleic-acid-binding Zn-ribbon protein
MSKAAQKVNIAGNLLICPICKHDEFWRRETLMNTRGATFLGFDWANKEAVNYVCGKCGYVFWFLDK